MQRAKGHRKVSLPFPILDILWETPAEKSESEVYFGVFRLALLMSPFLVRPVVGEGPSVSRLCGTECSSPTEDHASELKMDSELKDQTT